MQKIKAIKLINFRNYTNEIINIEKNLNLITGENAQGKTNILEAIYLGAFGRSYRTNTENDLIHWQNKEAFVELQIKRKTVTDFINVYLHENEKKKITLNKNEIKKSELFAIFNIVLFSPDDLVLVKGAPLLRRKFLDLEISQIDKVYYKTLLQYQRALFQRNNLLKKIKEGIAKVSMLDVWNEQLVNMSCKIVKRRLVSLKRISMLANLVQRKLTLGKENLLIKYNINGLKQDDFSFKKIPEEDFLKEFYQSKIKENLKKDLAMCQTSFGQHRDDFTFLINNYEAKKFASQGQQKTIILALKIAELEFIKSETGHYPVFLLDDVFSELDNQRKEQLLIFLKDKVQTFITSTNIISFKDVNSDVLIVQNGQVKAENATS